MNQQLENKLNTFFLHFPVEKYAKGDLIFRMSMSDQFFFFIESGVVKMTTTSSEGKNLVLSIFYPGSCFSLLTLINDGTNTYDFIALDSIVLRRVPREEFVKFLQENNDVLFEFHLRLLKGLQGLLHRIEQSTFVPAYNQVAGLLLYFARHFHEQKSSRALITVRITHQEIAEWLGLTRENVSVQMKKLERDGLISKNEGLIELIDQAKLEKLADPYDVR